jgi:phenylpropionate dioxygenase-like ring-hydroxylating dioxygenase large terminal subunit
MTNNPSERAIMPFLTKAWYMAAWSAEVTEGLMRRRLFGVPIVLYRLANGRVAALEDRCPHRFAPLSRGTRIGDSIQCGYHGLTFDPVGLCTHNPYNQRIPTGSSVRSFATRERDSIVWLWGSDSAPPDVDAIPHFDRMRSPSGLEPICGYVRIDANYEFVTDNLMDLSHIEFVHKGSFAGAGVIFAGKHEVHEVGAQLQSNWWMPGVKAPGHTYGIYPRDMLTDHWLDMRWEAPATMHLEIGATAQGASRTAGVIVQQAHILTPESESSTHYFWATTRTTDAASIEGDAALRGLMAQAFDVEDKPMIEAAYHNLDGVDFWERKPVYLGVDAGGARARRAIQNLLAKERRVAEREVGAGA